MMMIDIQAQLGAIRALVAFDLPVDERLRMLRDPTGAALLALLCNAAAKHDERLYAHKSALIRHAISLASDWWAKPHPYGEQYAADTVVYIETALARFAFHCKRDDPLLVDVLDSAPYSDRGWGGVRLQEMARELAHQWLLAQWEQDRKKGATRCDVESC